MFIKKKHVIQQAKHNEPLWPITNEYYYIVDSI